MEHLLNLPVQRLLSPTGTAPPHRQQDPWDISPLFQPTASDLLGHQPVSQTNASVPCLSPPGTAATASAASSPDLVVEERH